MRSFNATYTINEYGSFTRGASAYGFQGLPEKTFDALESFILANTSTGDTDAVELLSLSARRGVGKIISARNHVGIITMKDGAVIEILPKIAGGNISESDTKRIFLEMLKTLKDITFKEFNLSHLHTDRLSLFEIFIKMFLDEVSVLVKQGLKSAYTPIERNEYFYKGKLLAAENIKRNLVNRERFFVRYDDYNLNRAENRLIKSTLYFLLKQTTDNRNRQSATRLLTYFDGIQHSEHYDLDFSNCISDRNMSHYDKALSWCRIFLHGNSFTAFSGNQIAFALLFPMEKVFESYVAAKFKKHMSSGMVIRTQDKRYSLFDSPTKAFMLCPDLVMECTGHTVVMDTKWKLLSGNARYNGISQADMYQMYAYSKKYDAKEIVLLYPRTDAISKNNFKYSSEDNVSVRVSFIDLQDVDHSICELLDSCV